MKDKLVLWFNEIELKDLAQVGGKNSSSGGNDRRTNIERCQDSGRLCRDRVCL